MNLKYIIFALSFTTVVAGCNEDKFWILSLRQH